MTTAYPNLTGLLDRASKYATPEALGLLILWNDPQVKHLPEAEHLQVVRSALAEGRAVAAHLRSRFGDLAPDAMAKKLGLVLRESTLDPIRGAALLYAEYCARSSEIVLFREALGPLSRALENNSVAGHFGAIDFANVYIAHELYHHVEARRDEPAIARRHHVTLFRIGRFRWYSGLATLGEIAAGSCAQALLDLDCHPKLFDIITLARVNPEAAEAMVVALGEAVGVVAKDAPNLQCDGLAETTAVTRYPELKLRP